MNNIISHYAREIKLELLPKLRSFSYKLLILIKEILSTNLFQFVLIFLVSSIIAIILLRGALKTYDYEEQKRFEKTQRFIANLEQK